MTRYPCVNAWVWFWNGASGFLLCPSSTLMRSFRLASGFFWALNVSRCVIYIHCVFLPRLNWLVWPALIKQPGLYSQQTSSACLSYVYMWLFFQKLAQQRFGRKLSLNFHRQSYLTAELMQRQLSLMSPNWMISNRTPDDKHCQPQLCLSPSFCFQLLFLSHFLSSAVCLAVIIHFV